MESRYTKDVRIVAGGNDKGDDLNQLNNPTDIIHDIENNCLIIVDQGNRRIVCWSLADATAQGEILLPDTGCCGLTIDKNGSIYISDSKKHEVKRWKRGEKEVTIVAGGNYKGHNLNQINYPTHIYIDHDGSLFISNENNYRVVKWIKEAKQHVIVIDGNAKGNQLNQLSRLCGLYVDDNQQIYVSDWDNNRIMRWCKDAAEGTVIAGWELCR